MSQVLEQLKETGLEHKVRAQTVYPQPVQEGPGFGQSRQGNVTQSAWGCEVPYSSAFHILGEIEPSHQASSV